MWALRMSDPKWWMNVANSGWIDFKLENWLKFENLKRRIRRSYAEFTWIRGLNSFAKNWYKLSQVCKMDVIILEKLKVIFEINFWVESESKLRIYLSRQYFEIFEVIYAENSYFANIEVRFRQNNFFEIFSPIPPISSRYFFPSKWPKIVLYDVSSRSYGYF